jgi:hypothetical protein
MICVSAGLRRWLAARAAGRLRRGSALRVSSVVKWSQRYRTTGSVAPGKMGGQKRTIDDTWRHIGDLVATVQPSECTNYFVNAGYASVNV